MGILDKAKFWKKKDEDFGDLSGLGDFGLDKPSGADTGLGGSMDFPPLGGETPKPLHEEVMPSPQSQTMSDQFGLKPAQPSAVPQMQQAYQAPQYQAPQQPYRQSDVAEFGKDIEIIHAKLDAIKSSLDSINQRLATLERMAGGGDTQRPRYNW